MSNNPETISQDESEKSRFDAVSNLASNQTPNARTRARLALFDSSALIRHEAAFVLGRIGEPSDADLLLTFANDPSPFVRHEALLAIAELGNAQHIEPLKDLLTDNIPEVVASVKIAIERLTAETITREAETSPKVDSSLAACPWCGAVTDEEDEWGSLITHKSHCYWRNVHGDSIGRIRVNNSEKMQWNTRAAPTTAKADALTATELAWKIERLLCEQDDGMLASFRFKEDSKFPASVAKNAGQFGEKCFTEQFRLQSEVESLRGQLAEKDIEASTCAGCLKSTEEDCVRLEAEIDRLKEQIETQRAMIEGYKQRSKPNSE